MPKINTINDFTTAVHTALAAAFPECCVEITSVTKTMECARTVLLSRHKIKQSFLHSIWSRILKKFSPEKRWKKSSDRSSAAARLHYPIRKPVLMQMTLQILNLSRTISVISWLISSLKLLEEVPYRDYHGLAIVYYFRYAAEKGILTASITNSLAQMWDIDEEALFTLASGNTPRLCRGIVLTLDNVLGSSKSLKTKPYAGFDFTCSETDILPMYVATNASKTYGAAVILYDGLLETAAERLSSFYALPSSVHEFMFIPDTFGNVADIKQMVQEINADEVPEEEVLSDNIYHYDSNAHELKIVV